MGNKKLTDNIWLKAGLILGLLLLAALLIIVFFHFNNRQMTPDSSEVATQPSNQETQKDLAESEGNLSTSQKTEAKTIYKGTDKLLVTKSMTGLDIPWDIAFTPDGVMLVSERAGKLKARLGDGTVKVIQADFSDLSVKSELGLMGLVVDPNFTTNRRFYTCQGDRTANSIKVVAWSLAEDYRRALRVDDPLVGGIPSANIHVGCRLRFDDKGYLWISTGDAALGSHPQNLNSLAGKILRVNADNGQPASGNPFNQSEQAALVYSFGHRNPQGLAWQKDLQQMWVVEHGPDTDDEINLLVKGGNYGWDPVSSASDYYQNVPMTDKVKYPQALEAQWSSGNPTYALSGAVFLEGEMWGDKEGWLAVAALKNRSLYLFEFDQTGNFKNIFVVPELNETYGRLRTPVIGPNGALYITTSNGGGADFVLKVAPILTNQ